MNFIEKTRLIERIDQLIRMKATGSASDLASRIGIGRSTVYEVLEVMKNMGAEIEYCNQKRSYCYSCDKILAIGFVDRKMIKGGKNYLESKFFGQPCSKFEK